VERRLKEIVLSNKLCKRCNKLPPHGYVQGTGEFLLDTCLSCHRKSRKQDNFYETGSSKRTNVIRQNGKDDK
jgi:hypothetical protein